MKRIIVLASCLWLACGKPMLPPDVETAYNAERLAASRRGKTCPEAVSNIAAVDEKWEPKLQSYANRPIAPGITLVCK